MSILAQAIIQDMARGPGVTKKRGKNDTLYCKRCVIVHVQCINKDTACVRAENKDNHRSTGAIDGSICHPLNKILLL